MEKNDSETIKEHFRLADQFLQTANRNQQEGDLRSAADRAYYAMFHAASAALRQKGITTSTHKGIINQFGNSYVKAGLFDPELGKFLHRAFILRQDSDYKLFAEIDENRVEEIVGKAEEFVSEIKRLLDSA